MCFKYAVLAGLYIPTDLHHSDRLSSYTTHENAEDVPDFNMLTYPVALNDINKFETENTISVNVYVIDKCRTKKKQSAEKHVDVLESGGKRKQPSKKRSSKKRKVYQNRSFIDDEVILSGEDSGDESDMEDFIDEGSEIEDDNVSMCFAVQQQHQREQLQHRFAEKEDDDVTDNEEENTDDSQRGIVYSIRVTKKEHSRHVNLLLTEKYGTFHYSTIKNVSGFLRSQYSKHRGKTYYCYTCLHGFAA